MVILESDDELELGAPKRYEKLYLVTMSKSKSGSWQTAKVRSCRRRTWRSCEGCRTSLESREDEKAKTRRSPWRVGALERLKSNYDCDLVFEADEGAPDPVRGGPRTGHPTCCTTKQGPTARWYMYGDMNMHADLTLNLHRDMRNTMCMKGVIRHRDMLFICHSCMVQSCDMRSFVKCHRVWPPMYSAKNSMTNRVWRLRRPRQPQCAPPGNLLVIAGEEQLPLPSPEV